MRATTQQLVQPMRRFSDMAQAEQRGDTGRLDLSGLLLATAALMLPILLVAGTCVVVCRCLP